MAVWDLRLAQAGIQASVAAKQLSCSITGRIYGKSKTLMDERLKALSHQLRKWRLENGIKQEVAANELGVSAATWGHWEVGIRFPSPENLLALSQYTRIPIQEFFCRGSGD